MKTKLLIIIFLTIAVVFIYFENRNTISIGGHNLKVLVSDSEEERVKGLSNRESLNTDQGMLFIFPEPDYYQFWMKDMKFSIDIIWIDENKKVIDIAENVAPETYPRLFTSSKPAKYVVEVSSGWSKDKNLKIGDQMNDRFSFSF